MASSAQIDQTFICYLCARLHIDGGEFWAVFLKVFQCSIIQLCTASEEQCSYTVAASSQSLNAITCDLVTPRQVQHLQHSAAITEGLEGVVADGHTGGEIQLFEFGAKLAETETSAVCDLGAAVQVQHFDVSAVLSKCLHGGVSHTQAAPEAQLPQEIGRAHV